MCGTVGYMAPEMLTSVGQYDKEIDLWCMGVVLYSLIVGELPFHEETFEKTNKRVSSKEPDYSIWDKNFAGAKPLVKGLLTKNPKKRINVQELFSHKWLKGIDEKGDNIVVIKKNKDLIDLVEEKPQCLKI